MNYEQILHDILDQEATTTFWSGEAVVQPDVWRLEKQNFRWYYNDPEHPVFYTSITTWLKQVMPTAYFLEKWYRENDLAYLNEKLHYSSHYGTFAHTMMALLLKHGTIDLKNIHIAVEVYWHMNDIKPAEFLDELSTQEQWVRRIKNDLLCIVAFIQEKNFECIAIEWVGIHDASGKVPFSWANAIDLVGTIDFNGGRKTAIIDLKTGNLYDDQVYQLIGNKLTWDQSNDIKIDLLMNLAPKDFSNKKKYDLKNRKVDTDTFENFKDYAKIASRTLKQKPSWIPDYDQELGRESDLTSFMVSPEQYVKSKHGVTK